VPPAHPIVARDDETARAGMQGQCGRGKLVPMVDQRAPLSRRTLLAGAGTAGVLASIGCRAASGEAPSADKRAATDDVLDQALERLASRAPAYAGGLADHAPMVAEALITLGRGDAVGPWIDWYAPRLEGWPRSTGRIAPAAWAEALGKSDRVTDWRQFFTEELANASFREVLARWLPRLSAGMAGSAAHGVIRVSHIVRALAVRETGPRRRELAAGLAYWASTFHRLPDETRPAARLSVEQAIDRLEMVAPERRGRGSIVARLAPLTEMPSFAGVADLVDLRAEPATTLSAVTRAFARVYCSNAAESDGVIARIHAITGASAMRPLLPHLPTSLHRPLLRFAWQLDAAVYVTHATRGAAAPAIDAFPTAADLVAAAVDSRDEHAIKLTEVALREDMAAPDPAFRLAAAHWVRANLPA
jgi:hypothetical protein